MQISREKLREIALYVVVILLVIRFLLIPIYGDYKTKKEALSKKIKEYELALLSDRKENILSFQNLQERVYTKEEISFIQTLLVSHFNSISKKNNVLITNFDFSEPISEGKLTEINIMLKLEGKPSQVIKFLKDMRNYPKILDIKSFEAHEMENRYVFTVLISTYKVEI